MKAVCWRFESQGGTQTPKHCCCFLSLLMSHSPMTNLRSVAYLSDLHTVCVLKFNSPRLYWKPSAHSSAVLLRKWINWAWAHLCLIWLCIISQTDPWCRCLSWTLNVRLIAHFSGTHDVLSMLWNLCTHIEGDFGEKSMLPCPASSFCLVSRVTLCSMGRFSQVSPCEE